MRKQAKRRPEAASALSAREFSRWMWRQVTSMRTALLLLLLLSVVAVPGSFIPQRGVDARKVTQYFMDHPKLAPVLDRLGFFSVFSSPWFSAVYLLLMVSLLGCIIPRLGVYLKALRARPPKAPRRFDRLAQSGDFTTTATPDEVIAAGQRMLKRSRIDTTSEVDVATLSAEKGYLREAGNLLFHISIMVVLVGVAAGSLGGYRGNVIVTQGEGFSNALSAYNEFSSGALFNADRLAPFSFTMTDFYSRFETEGEAIGTPREFRATLDVKDRPGETVRSEVVKVNHPLSLTGADVYLVGQGYSPVVRITDASGAVVYDDAVPFLPLDATYLSTGVVKVPDASPQQLGFEGFFYPTAAQGGKGEGLTSVFPGAGNPRLGLNLFVGDLGLDEGDPQSVYTLDKDKLSQVKVDGKPFRVTLAVGESTDLPGGGSIELVDVKSWARFQISHTPFVWMPLLGTSLGLLGLLGSLFVRPRRTWIRARRTDAGTMVEVAAIDRVPRDEVDRDLSDLISALSAELKQAEPQHAELKHEDNT